MAETEQLTIKQAARLTGRDEKTIRRWITHKRLPDVEKDRKGRYLVARSAIERIMQEDEAEPRGYDEERIAALESRVSELEQQLSTLSSEFREFMDDITSRLAAHPSEQPKILKPPKPDYHISGTTEQSSTLPEDMQGLQPGAISMREFAKRHKPLTRDWLLPLIKKGLIPSRSIPYGYQGKEQPWFLPEHLPKVVAHIREHPQIPFGRCDDLGCPCHA